jgi:hypothetical protein
MFPFSKAANEELSALKLLSQGEGLYYSVGAARALPLVKKSYLMDDSPLTASHLGVCLMRVGKRKEAIEVLRKHHRKGGAFCAKLFWRKMHASLPVRKVGALPGDIVCSSRYIGAHPLLEPNAFASKKMHFASLWFVCFWQWFIHLHWTWCVPSDL